MKILLKNIFVLICLFAYARSRAATDTCDLLLSQNSNLKIELSENSALPIPMSDNNIALTPLNERDKSNLTKLFKNHEVNRFFLGGQTARLESLTHIARSNKSSAKLRESFDGQWTINFNGIFAGYLIMTALNPENIPTGPTQNFEKVSDDDLYLAIGYALMPEFRGNGIASKSLALAIKFAQTFLRPKYMFASTNYLNEASKKVLLKNGFSVLPTRSTSNIKFYREFK
ncbi:MAG: GNAT family N-acetyltransferase [Bdellovibrionales bacterium]